jgi:hypothetical protein
MQNDKATENSYHGMRIPENNYLFWLTPFACVKEIHKKFPAIEFTRVFIQHYNGLLKTSK